MAESALTEAEREWLGAAHVHLARHMLSVERLDDSHYPAGPQLSEHAARLPLEELETLHTRARGACAVLSGLARHETSARVQLALRRGIQLAAVLSAAIVEARRG